MKKKINSLYIYNPDLSEQLGFVSFYGYGAANIPYATSFLLPSVRKVDLAREVHEALIAHAEKAGLISRPKVNQSALLRAAFNESAQGSLQTKRLIIRPYTQEDDLKISALDEMDPSVDLGFFRKEKRDIEATQLSVGIFKADDGSLIGELDFFQDMKERPRMSYRILPAWQGQGYASEAHRASIAWTDRFLPNPVVWAEVVLGNNASISVLKKSGFQKTGEQVSDFPGYDGVTMTVMERLIPAPCAHP